ncbi:MAG TPA: ABC transporter ATP-binding protein [Pyrinomonadaceae bacterium]|nr:ABC transporter ATP-binding protein [Pyrinomonadaceae bacterium]
MNSSSQLSNARQLLRRLRPYRWLLLQALLLLIVLDGLRITQPKFTQYAIDWYIIPRDLTGLRWLAAIFLGVLIVSAVAQFFLNLLLKSAALRALADIRNELFQKLQRQDVAYIDRTPTGRVMTCLTSDVEALEELFTSGLTDILGGAIRIASVIAIMLWMDVRLTLVALITVPTFLVATTFFMRQTRHGYDVLRGRLGQINTFLQEHLSGALIIQIFNRETKSIARFSEINNQSRAASMKPIYHLAMFFPLVDLIGALGVALIMWYGGWRVMSSGGELLSLGALVAFVQYSGQLFQPLREIADRYTGLQGAVVSAQRIFKMLSLPAEIQSPTQPRKTGRARGEIEFEHVWFAYNDEDWVLKDVSFKVEAGQSVAVVGRTGAGKTTITNLLLRFYDVQRGRILLDGVDVREWDLKSLRENFAVVLQDLLLFPDTVESNIRLGREEISAERVEWAAREVCADHFIRLLPDGYHTNVHERGGGLSAGQKQLITLARALVSEPSLLILDEATNSVDTETERVVQRAIERVMHGRTTFQVAHHLSTVRKTSLIIVLEHGEVCEQGDHQKLLAERGLYWQLYQLQSSTEFRSQYVSQLGWSG